MPFIILHFADDEKEVIVNPKAIESVCGSNVLFHGYSYQVKESYEEIKKALLNAMELGDVAE